jgi:hypothetical protein
MRRAERSGRATADFISFESAQDLVCAVCAQPSDQLASFEQCRLRGRHELTGDAFYYSGRTRTFVPWFALLRPTAAGRPLRWSGD